MNRGRDSSFKTDEHRCALAPHTSEMSLRAYFEQFGKLSDCVVMFDRGRNRSRCFGFVTFVEPYLAEMVSNMQHFLDGKAIDVKKAVPRSESYSDIVNYDHNFITNKIFVGGLPVPLDEKELKRVFSTFGAITDIVIIQDKNTKQSRGFGFVEFIDHESVDRVMKNYYKINVLGKWVECKKALPKANYPENMSKLMRGAKLMRFEDDEDKDERQEVSNLEQIDNENFCLSSFEDRVCKPINNQQLGEVRGVLGDATNIYRGRGIEYEAKEFVSVDEDKENEGLGFAARLKPTDPRKGKLLQQNKARIDLTSSRENRSFTLS